MAEEFKAMIRGKFELLSNLHNTFIDVDINDVISTFYTEMIETANELLGSITLKRTQDYNRYSQSV